MSRIRTVMKPLKYADSALKTKTENKLEQLEILLTGYGVSDDVWAVFDKLAEKAVYHLMNASLGRESNRDNNKKALLDLMADADSMMDAVLVKTKVDTDTMGYNMYLNVMKSWRKDVGLTTNKEAVLSSLNTKLTGLMQDYGYDLTEDAWVKCLEIYSLADGNPDKMETPLWVILCESVDGKLDMNYPIDWSFEPRNIAQNFTNLL